jgi:hypothetical protein
MERSSLTGLNQILVVVPHKLNSTKEKRFEVLPVKLGHPMVAQLFEFIQKYYY